MKEWISRPRPSAALLRALVLMLSATTAYADGEVMVVDRYRVTPDSVEIEVGEQVTFQVAETESLVDAMRAIRIIIDGLVRSPRLEPGERWPFTFTRAGVYDLHIEEHPGVDGAVVVR